MFIAMKWLGNYRLTVQVLVRWVLGWVGGPAFGKP
jgi:hypothetical protein